MTDPEDETFDQLYELEDKYNCEVSGRLVTYHGDYLPDQLIHDIEDMSAIKILAIEPLEGNKHLIETG